ncbi:hypothetical protein QCA50_009836 [Cerrena zonata]|uniref:Uncharacterized protein n=1 Tax=Cerrena zonata TaxID=2478898 RepID=A0AAW0G1H5_9APHY
MFMIQILEEGRDIVDSWKALSAEMVFMGRYWKQAFERLGVILIEVLAPIAREVNRLYEYQGEIHAFNANTGIFSLAP